MNAAKASNLAQLNIVPGCKVMRQIIDYETDKTTLVVVAKCAYTPKAIADVIKAHNLTDYSHWVIGPGGRELWTLDGKLARQIG